MLGDEYDPIWGEREGADDYIYDEYYLEEEEEKEEKDSFSNDDDDEDEEGKIDEGENTLTQPFNTQTCYQMHEIPKEGEYDGLDSDLKPADDDNEPKIDSQPITPNPKDPNKCREEIIAFSDKILFDHYDPSQTNELLQELNNLQQWHNETHAQEGNACDLLLAFARFALIPNERNALSVTSGFRYENSATTARPLIKKTNEDYLKDCNDYAERLNASSPEDLVSKLSNACDNKINEMRQYATREQAGKNAYELSNQINSEQFACAYTLSNRDSYLIPPCNAAAYAVQEKAKQLKTVMQEWISPNNKQHENTYAKMKLGAEGEERVFNTLSKLPGTKIIRNASMIYRGEKCECDFVAIAPNGIFIIEVKNYTNKKIKVESNGKGRLYYKDSGKLAREFTITEQLGREENVLQGKLNEKFGNRYFSTVKTIAVVANDTCIIDDATNTICAYDALRFMMTKDKSIALSAKDINSIYDCLINASKNVAAGQFETIDYPAIIEEMRNSIELSIIPLWIHKYQQDIKRVLRPRLLSWAQNEQKQRDFQEMVDRRQAEFQRERQVAEEQEAAARKAEYEKNEQEIRKFQLSLAKAASIVSIVTLIGGFASFIFSILPSYDFTLIFVPLIYASESAAFVIAGCWVYGNMMDASETTYREGAKKLFIAVPLTVIMAFCLVKGVRSGNFLLILFTSVASVIYAFITAYRAEECIGNGTVDKSAWHKRATKLRDNFAIPFCIVIVLLAITLAVVIIETLGL